MKILHHSEVASVCRAGDANYRHVGQWLHLVLGESIRLMFDGFVILFQVLWRARFVTWPVFSWGGGVAAWSPVFVREREPCDDDP